MRGANEEVHEERGEEPDRNKSPAKGARKDLAVGMASRGHEEALQRDGVKEDEPERREAGAKRHGEPEEEYGEDGWQRDAEEAGREGEADPELASSA